MPLRARQALVIAVGAVAAVFMVWLGLWQLQVFTDQSVASAQLRAEAPASPLLDHVDRDGTVGDIYGKPAIAVGYYLPDQEELVLGEDGVIRILSALQLADGRVLPVVRGTVSSGQRAPDPPGGEIQQVGIFLPSEPGAEHPLPDGYSLGSVRLPQLAQLWEQPLLPGFITLESEESARQGLSPATVTLPDGDGSWRNSGYALQWWAFALFGLGIAIKIAQAMGKKERMTLAEAPTGTSASDQ